jgi:ppGpp synthetase/RelA/SpoT-type nucleotidyltranferase
MVVTADDGLDKVAQLRKRYEDEEPRYKRLREEVIYSIEAELQAASIKVHSVNGRVKELEGFLEKVERKSYEDPFTQAQDLVGIRVVCLFMSDIPAVEAIIARCSR